MTGAILRKRVITALVGGPVVILALYAGGPWWALLLAVVGVWGGLELRGLLVARGLGEPGGDVLAAGALAGLVLSWLSLEGVAAGFGALLVPAALLAYATLRAYLRGASVLAEGAAATFAFAYLGVFLGHWWLLREQGTPFGQAVGLVALLVTWGADTGAYFIGRLVGRHKLAPRLSPSKTVEGAIGGLAVAVLVALILGPPIGLRRGPLLALFGLVTGMAAEGGDLLESALKRDSGVKDSGRLLPGHGGILDRADSFLMAGVAAYYFLLLAGAL